jgi:hypothetical protein
VADCQKSRRDRLFGQGSNVQAVFGRHKRWRLGLQDYKNITTL